MGLKGWIASHTGMASFYATGTGRLMASTEFFGDTDARLVADVDGEVLVSDAGGPVGQAVTYTLGDDSVTLTRQQPPGRVSRADWVTDMDGNLVGEGNLLWSDDRDYNTGATVFTSARGAQIPRFPLGQEPPQGTIEIVTEGAGTLRLRDLAASHTPLWVIRNMAAGGRPAYDVEGSRLIVPSRLREVMSENRLATQRKWQVQYSRLPGERPSGSPVVTWGQWEDWGKTNSPAGWRDWSALEVAKRVAGMP